MNREYHRSQWPVRYALSSKVRYTTLWHGETRGKLAAIIYPSGHKVEMTRDTTGRLTELAVDNGPTLVSDIEYLPLGPAGEYTFGNSEVLTKTRDQNYWTTNVTSPALGLHFRRDAMGVAQRFFRKFPETVIPV